MRQKMITLKNILQEGNIDAQTQISEIVKKFEKFSADYTNLISELNTINSSIDTLYHSIIDAYPREQLEELYSSIKGNTLFSLQQLKSYISSHKTKLDKIQSLINANDKIAISIPTDLIKDIGKDNIITLIKYIKQKNSNFDYNNNNQIRMHSTNASYGRDIDSNHLKKALISAKNYVTTHTNNKLNQILIKYTNFTVEYDKKYDILKFKKI